MAIHDSVTDRYLAPGGHWTPCADEALLLAAGAAEAWVRHYSCEPAPLTVVVCPAQRFAA